MKTAARVSVVPTCRVERTSCEVLHTRDDGQFHQVEDPDGEHVPPAGDLVAAIGEDPPHGRVLVPLGACHPGVEEAVGYQLVPLGNRLQVPPDLVAERVAACRDVVELLEHRHVYVRLDVAHHTRVAVPVPGSPDAACLVDDPDPLEAGPTELSTREDACDASAHDHDVDIVCDRFALYEGSERVVTVTGEVLVGPQVANVCAPGDQPPVAFGEVLGTDGFGVVAGRRRSGPGHAATLCQVRISASWAGSAGTRRSSSTGWYPSLGQ